MMRFFFKPPGPRFIDHCQWLLLMVANLYSSDPMFAMNRSSLITEDLQGKANLIKIQKPWKVNYWNFPFLQFNSKSLYLPDAAIQRQWKYERKSHKVKIHCVFFSLPVSEPKWKNLPTQREADLRWKFHFGTENQEDQFEINTPCHCQTKIQDSLKSLSKAGRTSSYR